jgi:hypothetical protein
VDDVDVIEGYVRELETALRRAGRPTEPLVDEARAHLCEDAARIAAADGCSDDEAARRALARFGSVGEVMRAARKHAPLVAARLARAATLLLWAVLAWEVVDGFVNGDLWPINHEDLWLLFVGELAFAGVYLWRALATGRGPQWLRPVLAANGALALALVVGEAIVNVKLWPTRPNIHIGVSREMGGLISPLWIVMALQAITGLAALSARQQATQVGQPSSPVE